MLSSYPMFVTVLILVISELTRPALAQDAVVEKGAVLEAKEEVKLRASPPSQKFLFIVSEPGQEVSSIRPGQKLTVEEVKHIKVPLGEHIWVKGKTDTGNVGWGYYGSEEKSENFKLE